MNSVLRLFSTFWCDPVFSQTKQENVNMLPLITGNYDGNFSLFSAFYTPNDGGGLYKIKVCLQVCQRTSAYVKKVKPFESPKEAA